MYEIDFLPVGDEGQSGDAIAIRFTRPDNGQYGHVIIDAGFQDDGEALVQHVQEYFNARTIELAIVTHPDGDHIGGMGTVLRELDVGVLAVHDIRAHGGGSLPAADAVDELMRIARSRGTSLHEPFAGSAGFGAMTILGPTAEYYDLLVAGQVEEERIGRGAGRRRIRSALRAGVDRFLSYLPAEVGFEDAGGTNPRNNSSVVTLLVVGDDRMLFTGDAGVPALDLAWDFAEAQGDTTPPSFMQVPHAGSRHNASSDLLNRILGVPGTAPLSSRTAQVSVASKSEKHPSPRVVNAYIRRGCRVYETRGKSIHHFSNDAPPRPTWVTATPLEPMNEDTED
jgi:hypothetical protein